MAENNNLSVIPLSDIKTMAVTATKSKLFGNMDEYQALSLMLLCQAKNMHPMVAMERYHIIQGRPSMKAEAMMSAFQQAGGSVRWIELSETACEAEFTHPTGGQVPIRWTLEMARKAGLGNKDNWKNYPRAMLRSRVVSEGVRTVCPACVLGIYTPEEIIDLSPAEYKEVPADDKRKLSIENMSAGEPTGRPRGKAAPKQEAAKTVTHEPDPQPPIDVEQEFTLDQPAETRMQKIERLTSYTTGDSPSITTAIILKRVNDNRKEMKIDGTVKSINDMMDVEIEEMLGELE